MECRDAEMAILQAGNHLPAHVADHVKACSSCRTFARTQRFLLESDEHYSPAATLDQAVLRQAHECLTRLRGARPRPVLKMATGWLAVAAGLVVVFALPAMLRHARFSPPTVAPGASPTVAQSPARPVAVAAVDKSSDDPVTWQAASTDLTALKREMELASAQLKDIGQPRVQPAVEDLSDEAPSSQGIGGLNTALFEMECDLYFQMHELSTGG